MELKKIREMFEKHYDLVGQSVTYDGRTYIVNRFTAFYREPADYEPFGSNYDPFIVLAFGNSTGIEFTLPFSEMEKLERNLK